ncbi:MAG: hypothetical protein AAF628_23460 [Planctomycetota bacterium]
MESALLWPARWCAAAFALAAGLCAQADQHTIFAHGFEGGINIAPMGDVNGDGHADYAIAREVGSSISSFIEAISGYDGQPFWSVNETTGAGVGRLGHSLAAAGDRDGDGWPEILVGDPGHNVNSGQATVYDGATGAVLARLGPGSPSDFMGVVVGDAGDIDGDGTSDYAVSSTGYPSGSGWGRVQIYSGADFSFLRSWSGDSAPLEFGVAAIGLGDIDGDGIADMAFGARGSSSGDGYIRVMSGRFSFVRWEKRLSTHTLRGLIATPDRDGDGFKDLAAVWKVRASTLGLLETYGSVSGSILATTTLRFGTISTSPPAAGPQPLDTFPDYDGDGVDDLGVAGDRASTGIRAALYSGATLAPLTTLENGDEGAFVDIGDVNADGNPDYANVWMVGSRANLVIRSVDPLPVSVTPHEISVTAGGLAPYSIDVGAAHAGKLYFVLGSLTGYDPGFRLFGWDVPLNIDPYLIFTATYPNLPILTGSFGLLDGAGKATCNFSLLPDPAFAGLTFHHAAVVFNPVQGFDFVTNARPVTSLP